MAFGSSNPTLETLNLTLLPTSISSAITEIRLGNGQGEFSYDPTPILLASTENEATEIYVNVNTQQYTTENTDITISLAELQTTFPNLKKINLEIGWYVTSLNCSETLVLPGVTTANLNTLPYEWNVASLTRSEAYVVSQSNGMPAFRGTPSDQSLLNLLLALSALELDISVCLTLFPDIPINNTLLTPYSDNGVSVGQNVYPQGSLITTSPAQGYLNSVWGTLGADIQLQAFFGSENALSYTCTFNSAGTLTTNYNFPVQTFTYSNFVVYYATLLSSFLATFSGVTLTDFLIGKNLSGLTSVQGASGGYTAVEQLTNLAEEVSTLFAGLDVNISYVADWNEWQGTQNESVTNLTFPSSRIFNMDTLWASPYISYIAISANYPTTDWRNFGNNYDGLYYPSSTNQPYIVEGLLGQQYYDYFYASSSDRTNQIRTNIVGPTENTSWIYQLKNYDAWIENYHYNFDGSSFSGSATTWVPDSKKIYLYDIQCPSVNLGTNQPEAYLNTVSTDYALPYFSNGSQDTNVVSNFYGIFSTYKPYISPDGNVINWSAAYWDDRPYPWYPLLSTQWVDCPNYPLDNCLNNKLVAVDPTVVYQQFVNYNLLMTEQFASNPYWVTLVQAMDVQWNNLFNSAVNQLQNIRNVNVIEDELKAANVRQMGYVIPDYGLQYYQYDNLMRYLGTFYLTRGNSNQFVNFVSFFSEIKFNYIPLYANGLNYYTLTSEPGTLVTQAASGTWIPTPYYDVSYDPSKYPDISETLYRQLLVESAPIYLVLRNFVGEIFIAAVPLYLSSGFIDLDIEIAPLYPYQLPPAGLSLLTIAAPVISVYGVPFTVTGTTLGTSDTVSVSLYSTNNLTLILANLVLPLSTVTTTSVDNTWSVVLTSTSSSIVYAVVSDTTQIENNGTTTLNEVAISSTINYTQRPIITSLGPNYQIALENGNVFGMEANVPTLALATYAGTIVVGNNLTVTGTTYLAGNSVQVALGSSSTVMPVSGFTNAVISGSTWSASLPTSTIGTFYIWAVLTSDIDIYTVSSSISIT